MRLNHPTDKRLHVEIHVGPCGLVLKVWLAGDREPTFSWSPADEDWDASRPPFWEAVDILSSLGFFSVSDIAIVLDAEVADEPRQFLSRRLRYVAEVVATLRAASE